MTKKEAVELIEEAIARIEYKPRNHRRLGWQCGGAYWRLAKVLRYYLEPQLEAQEGKEHADFIIRNHGRVTKTDDGKGREVSQ